MAIFVRNCKLPTIYANTSMTSVRAWYFREVFLLGGWTENSNNGDAAWSSALNLLASVAAGPNGLAVDATKPREVYSPSGIFLSTHVGYTLALHAVNDQNRGMWRITEYIDANHVKVDPLSFSPYGWITESGIAARISAGGGLVLTNGAWVLLDGPVGSNMQVRISYVSNNTGYIYVRPRGKLGDPSECSSGTFDAYYMTHQRFNCYLSGDDALIFITQWASNSGFESGLLFQVGRLLDADAADTDPAFVLSVTASATPLYWGLIRMLTTGLTQIECYAVTLKPGITAAIGGTNGNLYNLFGRRVVNGGFAALRSPWVVLDDTAVTGACVRGRLPLIRSTYLFFENLAPIDTAGDWYHLYYGIAMPRNGPNDLMLAKGYGG